MAKIYIGNTLLAITPESTDSSGNFMAEAAYTKAGADTAISTAINNLIDSAPDTLDTLNELAEALNDDKDFHVTINDLLNLKAPLANPSLTGIPTAPTAAVDNDTTQIATTAFVKSVVATEDTIAEMNDVTLTSITNGELLVSSGGNFINNTLDEAGIAPVVGPTFTTAPANFDAGILLSTAPTTSANVGVVRQNAYFKQGGIRLQRTNTVNDEMSFRWGGAAADTFLLQQMYGNVAQGNITFSGNTPSGSNKIKIDADNIELGTSGTTLTKLISDATIANNKKITFLDSRDATDGLHFQHSGTDEFVQMGFYGAVGETNHGRFVITHKDGTAANTDVLTIPKGGASVTIHKNTTIAGNLQVNGTTNALHIKESVASSISRGLKLQNTSSTDGQGTGIAFTNSNTNANVNASIDSVRALQSALTGNLIFSTQSASAALTARMTINSTGEVGIGKTATTGVELDVNGDIAASGSITGATLAGTLTTAAQTNITSVGTLTGLIVSDDVGIGATSPSERLEVREDIDNNFARLKINNEGTNGGATVLFSEGATDHASISAAYGSGHKTFIIKNSMPDGTLKLQTENSSAVVNDGLMIDGDSNVSIPNGTLTVAGQIESTTGAVVASGGTFTVVSGTCQTAAQPNITSIGTLSDLTVTGNVTGTANPTSAGHLVNKIYAETNFQSKDGSTGDVAITGGLSVSGNLIVNGTTTTVNTTNLDVTDNIILLNSGMTGSNAKDIGVIFERGSTGDNAAIVWDESTDKFKFGTTTNAGTGDTASIDTTLGDIEAANLDLEGSIDALAITCQEGLTGSSLYINGTTLNVDDSESTVGIGIAAGEDYKLNVAGKVNVTNDLSVDTDTLKVDSTNDRVGINKAAPDEALDVVGNIKASSVLTNTITSLANSNLNITANGAFGLTSDNLVLNDNVLGISAASGTCLAINDSSAGQNFINANISTAVFAVTGDISASGDVDITGDCNVSGDSLFDGSVTLTGSVELSGGENISFTTSSGNIDGLCDVDVTGSVQASKWLRPGIYADATARDAAITSPAAGMMVFVTDGDGSGNPKFQGYTGSAWVDFH